MKGYRFYAEMPEARKSKSASKAHPFFPWTVKALTEAAKVNHPVYSPICCVTAVELDDRGRPVYNSGNSPFFGMVAAAIDLNPYSYGYCSGSADYLRRRCTRISESLARKLSPNLFAYLES